MKSTYLLPRWCRPIGLLLGIPGLILGYLYSINDYEIPGFGFNLRKSDGLFQQRFENFTNELAIFLVVIGLSFTAFAKVKKEDELTSKIRLSALYWSMFLYYSTYLSGLFFLVFLNGFPSIISDHLNELSVVLPLLIFNLRFYYLLYARKDRFVTQAPRFLPCRPFRFTGIICTFAGATGIGFALAKGILLDSDTRWPAISFFVFFAGLLCWAFSKHKTEDEMMIQQRMESLQLAFYFNYLLFLVATLSFYSLDYLLVLIVGQFSLLLYFIIRMEYVRLKQHNISDPLEKGMTS